MESHLDDQAHLKTRILVSDLGITLPDVQYTMKMSSDCSFDRFSQREIYSTAAFELVDQPSGAPALHHILGHPHGTMVQFTR